MIIFVLFGHFTLFFKISPFFKPPPVHQCYCREERNETFFDMFRREEILVRQKREINSFSP